MNNLSQYITEKMHLTKDAIKSNRSAFHEKMTFDEWKDYLDDHKLRLFQYTKGGNVYAVHLADGKYFVKDIYTKHDKEAYSVPFIDIEIDSGNDYFVFYSWGDRKGIKVNINSHNDSELMESDFGYDDLDTNVDKKKAIKDHTSWGFSFTQHNANILLDILTQMYDVCK